MGIKHFGEVTFAGGVKRIIHENSPEVKAFLEEFPEATVVIAIGTVVSKLQKGANKAKNALNSDEKAEDGEVIEEKPKKAKKTKK